MTSTIVPLPLLFSLDNVEKWHKPKAQEMVTQRDIRTYACAETILNYAKKHPACIALHHLQNVDFCDVVYVDYKNDPSELKILAYFINKLFFKTLNVFDVRCLQKCDSLGLKIRERVEFCGPEGSLEKFELEIVNPEASLFVYGCVNDFNRTYLHFPHPPIFYLPADEVVKMYFEKLCAGSLTFQDVWTIASLRLEIGLQLPVNTALEKESVQTAELSIINPDASPCVFKFVNAFNLKYRYPSYVPTLYVSHRQFPCISDHATYQFPFICGRHPLYQFPVRMANGVYVQSEDIGALSGSLVRKGIDSSLIQQLIFYTRTIDRSRFFFPYLFFDFVQMMVNLNGSLPPHIRYVSEEEEAGMWIIKKRRILATIRPRQDLSTIALFFHYLAEIACRELQMMGQGSRSTKGCKFC